MRCCNLRKEQETRSWLLQLQNQNILGSEHCHPLKHRSFSFPQQSHAHLTSAAARKSLCVLPHSNPAPGHLQICVSKKGVWESSAGEMQQYREVAFINCCSPHPLYQLFWTLTFPTQAHARHLRVDNLPRQAVNTSHLMLPLRIMCLPVSPVM